MAYDLILRASIHPDYTDNLVTDFEKKIRGQIVKDKRRIFVQLFSYLYGYDFESLQRDILKQIVLDSHVSLSKAERAKMLRVALDAYHRWFSEDYSLLLNECHERIVSHKVMSAAGEDLPFV